MFDLLFSTRYQEQPQDEQIELDAREEAEKRNLEAAGVFANMERTILG